ncbi:polyisoprenoid-binding protein [Flavobacteriaceae bacterium AU392]|nr:polyisoprenoid-binding protein [Flavobacteriaceae bacterium]RKM85896.1 polyisoprenoid-binding protein [Flavobacteriaceae bacterium AU392]
MIILKFKNSIQKPLVCLIYFIITSVLQAQKIEHYVTEPNHSTIGFTIPIAGGLTSVSGKFTKFLITLDYVESDFTKSIFKARIDVNSINTGIERRDSHLKSEEFFNIGKFPEILFESKKIIKTNEGYLVNGDFMMHGILKPISFLLKHNGTIDRYLAFEVQSSILRSDYEIGTNYIHPGFSNFLSDRIDFTFKFWVIGPIPEEMLGKVKRQLYEKVKQ